jgi:hypothetical protein
MTCLRSLWFIKSKFIIHGLVSYFVWHSWALNNGVYDALAFVSVILGICEPEDWPPLFGSLRAAWTVRGFWGEFWHRIVHRSYTGYGHLVASTLRLAPGSWTRRLFVQFVVFLLSGVVHAVMTWQMGYTCGYFEDIQWFCLNFLAILVEGATQSAWRKMGWQLPAWIAQPIGYTWVFGFLFWSLPKTHYPKLRCAPR